MKATTTLNVRDDMVVTVRIAMTIREADELLTILKDISKWPAGDLRHIIWSSLYKARQAYDSEESV